MKANEGMIKNNYGTFSVTADDAEGAYKRHAHSVNPDKIRVVPITSAVHKRTGIRVFKGRVGSSLFQWTRKDD